MRTKEKERAKAETFFPVKESNQKLFEMAPPQEKAVKKLNYFSLRKLCCLSLRVHSFLEKMIFLIFRLFPYISAALFLIT
jgi:hypothetical protein